MFSLTSTGTWTLPLWTAMVKPTISGRIIERRDQVLIGFLLPLRGLHLLDEVVVDERAFLE